MSSKRVALLEIWKTFEEQHGSEEDLSKVQGMMPIVSKRRHVDEETGQVVEGRFCFEFISVGSLRVRSDWEMVFADDEREANPTSFKFLQMAHAWKAKQGGGGSGGGSLLSGFARASTDISATNKAEEDGKQLSARDDDDASSVGSSSGEE
jgi:crooked neck